MTMVNREPKTPAKQVEFWEKKREHAKQRVARRETRLQELATREDSLRKHMQERIDAGLPVARLQSQLETIAAQRKTHRDKLVDEQEQLDDAAAQLSSREDHPYG